MQRDNTTWINDLQSEGEQQSAALQDLREILMRILPKALSRWLRPDDPHFDHLIEDTTQETLQRVLDRLDTFEGRSKFTTWVYTIAVRIGLSELRLRKWQEASLETLETSSDPEETSFSRFAAAKPNPETATAQADALALVMTAMEEQLTPYQLKVMQAVVMGGEPLDILAERLGKDRNTLYKVMHDARMKLKAHLELTGHPPDELLALFS